MSIELESPVGKPRRDDAALQHPIFLDRRDCERAEVRVFAKEPRSPEGGTGRKAASGRDVANLGIEPLGWIQKPLEHTPVLELDQNPFDPPGLWRLEPRGLPFTLSSERLGASLRLLSESCPSHQQVDSEHDQNAEQ